MRIKLFFIFLFLYTSSILNAREFRDTVVVNGIKYALSNDNYDGHYSAKVISNDDSPYQRDIVIPENIIHEVMTFISTSASTGEVWELREKKFPVEEIDINAFKDCSDLTSINMPSTIIKIGLNRNECLSNPFVGCSKLNSIIVDENNEYFDSRDNCNAIITKKGTDGLGKDPWYGNANVLIVGCKSTVIPNSVTAIGEYAFARNSAIESTIIPSSVKYISCGAFIGCGNIKDMYCYGGFKSLQKYGVNPVFDESVKKATLHVPDSLIEKYKDNEDWNVFKEVVPIEKVTDFNLIYYVDGEEYKREQYKYDDEITPLEEPVRDGYTFSGWSEIPEKMPGKDVKVDGTFASNEVKEGGVIYQAFNERAAVIGNDNAAGEVKIAASVTFNEKLVPVTDIVDFSFKNNTNITSVVIPESVMKIGDEAFYGCKNLTKIELGKSVNQIEPRAFAGIDKLTDVICYTEDIVPDADRTAFENSYTEDYVTLHVPAKALDKYKEVAPWKNFKNIVSIEGTEPPQIFKLIYMVDGEVYKTVEIEEGAEITPEAEPTKDGYVFSGWSEIPDVMPSEDVTITGTFTEDTSDGDDDDVVNPEEGDTDETSVGEEVIPISGAKQTTWCSAYDLDFTGIDGVKAYIASGYDRETGIIWLTRVNKVPAGEGILIIADKGDYTIPHVSTSAYYANLMVGTLKAMVLNETDGEYTNYYLSNGTSGVGFYKVNGSVDIKANRAYLPLLKGTTKANTRFIGIGFEDEDGTTGIEVQSSIFNLQSKDVYYNLHGQRVDNPAKGIYIRNGKKVIIK